MEEGPANLSIRSVQVPDELSGQEGTSIGYSLTFSERDQEIHGVPAEVPFLTTGTNRTKADVELITQAEDLAARFDKRNGNTWHSDRLASDAAFATR